jgi:hypothetical protein
VINDEMLYGPGDGLGLLGADGEGTGDDSSVRSPTSTRTEVRSPTSTRTEVRSPTRTATEVRSPTRTSTETEATTKGNFTATVTGGAGAGACTTVTINVPGYGDVQKQYADSDRNEVYESRAARDGGVANMPSAARSQMTQSAEDFIMGESDVMGSLNDHSDEFPNNIEDDSQFEGPHEIGEDEGGEEADPEVEAELESDRGSGSMAQDGRLEVADDDLVKSEMGAASAADRIAAEIGAAEEADQYSAQLGSSAMYGPTEIGNAEMVEQADVMGGAADDGPTEIGDDDIPEGTTPWDTFAAEPIRVGGGLPYQYEIGSPAMAVVKVIEKARDNRQPPPPMKAVDVDARPADNNDWGLTDTFIGAALKTGNQDPFPLMSALLLRCGAGQVEPRFVRVDTEDSYKQFRTENSPELSDLRNRVDDLHDRMAEHMSTPGAHDDLADDVEDLTLMGEDVQNAEKDKRIELWMPKRFDGLVEAWREGDFVCASIALPGKRGEIRICTSMEPIVKCVSEMSRHAAEAGVPASAVVGALPAMGCVLGAGTLIKEMASAAPSILQRPETNKMGAFVVRIEPKANPALSALAMLVAACRAGNKQACDEWARLGATAAGPVRQAMGEALQIVKAAA